MSEIERVKDFGFSVGQDAGMLRKLGATDQQICNYVKFEGLQIPVEYDNAYKAAARRGFAQFEKKFAHPIYNMHKANLQKLIEMNAACLQSY
jgi:hypothetical protein